MGDPALRNVKQRVPGEGQSSPQDIYERNINVKVLDRGGEKIRVVASFLDLEHSFHAEMSVDVASGRIEKPWAMMSKRPFPRLCLPALDNIHKLEGEIIGRGINRRVVDLLGKSQGCVHLVEIFQAAIGFTATVLIGLRTGLSEDPRKTEEENRDMWLPTLQNTCQVFRVEPPAAKG